MPPLRPRGNFRESPVRSPPQEVRGPFDAWAATTGTDWGDLHARAPGHERVRARGRSRLPYVLGLWRGLAGLWGMYQWLDRAPGGRNETRGPDDPLNWFRRH